MQELTLELLLPLKVFEIYEKAELERYAEETGGEIYTWQTLCIKNWLQKGFHIIDELGYVVLPKDLPEQIDMCDDILEDGDE